MLLDTMCNTFGGIILLAVMVTLLARRERQEGTVNNTESVKVQQHQLSIAKDSLSRSIQLRDQLKQKAISGDWKAQVELLRSRQEIQVEIQKLSDHTRKSLQVLETAAALTPTDRLKTLEEEIVTAELQTLEARNRLAAAQTNTARISARISEVTQNQALLVKDSQQKLRLPMERPSKQDPIYVIARYGRIFPCLNDDLSRNEADIVWAKNSEGREAKPMRDRGFKDTDKIHDYFQRIPSRRFYVAFLVYEDSFSIFNKAKDLAVRAGVTYGWEPYIVSRSVQFVDEGGFTPKPQ
jgi:hypothetical protein